MGTVLVVSDNINGFFALSVCNVLESKHINIIKTSFDDDFLVDFLKESELVFILLSDEFNANSVFVSGLKKKCDEYDKKVAVYGSSERVDDIKKVFTGSNLVESFIRPMDNDEVVYKLSNILDGAGKKKHVLVVDDSGPMLRTVMGWLEEKYQVSLANSAANAATKISKDKPDLILLDYEMPICSGPEFLKQLREDENTKDIPVIFLTAQDDADSVKAVLSLKPQGYILKSLSGTQVVEKIDKFFMM